MSPRAAPAPLLCPPQPLSLRAALPKNPWQTSSPSARNKMSSLGVLFALIPPFQYALDGNFSLKQSRSKQIYKNPDFYFLYLFFITRPKSFIESDLGPPHFFPITTLPERLLLARGAKQSALQAPPSLAATVMGLGTFHPNLLPVPPSPAGETPPGPPSSSLSPSSSPLPSSASRWVSSLHRQPGPSLICPAACVVG